VPWQWKVGSWPPHVYSEHHTPLPSSLIHPFICLLFV
jgi:hypothetical protein